MLSDTCRKVLRILIQTAKNGEVITYQELAHLSVGQNLSKQPKVSWLFKVLANVSSYTYDEIGAFITVLVVNQHTGTPGAGFLQLAGQEIADDPSLLVNSDTYIRSHMKMVHSLDFKALDKLLVC